MALWPPLVGDLRADTQIPLRPDGLQADERDPVLDLIARHEYSGRADDAGYFVNLEHDARIALWIEAVAAIWVNGESDGYATDPESAARDYILSNPVMADRIGRLADYPRDAIRRLMMKSIHVGRLALPDGRGELVLVEIVHPLHCWGVRCETYLLLKRRGRFTVVGDYWPNFVSGAPGCAIVLSARTNGFNDLLSLDNDDNAALRFRWNGKVYRAKELRPAPATTCCRRGMDYQQPSQCPAN